MILYFASDLIWATRIKGVADDLGIPCRPVRNPDMLAQRLADTSPKALILDLETEESGLALLRALRSDQRGAGIRVVAFAPHVKKDLMRAAKEAGADEVLTRGAFDHGLAEILTSLNPIA